MGIEDTEVGRRERVGRPAPVVKAGTWGKVVGVMGLTHLKIEFEEHGEIYIKTSNVAFGPGGKSFADVVKDEVQEQARIAKKSRKRKKRKRKRKKDSGFVTGDIVYLLQAVF